MSKVKPPKSKGIPSKHLHARSTFLYEAACYLSLQASTVAANTSPGSNAKEQPCGKQASFDSHSPLALRLGSDLQQVSRKAQLRLSVDLKRSLCKSCNTVLIPGRTASQSVENHSKGGKKPWADVLVVTCNFCGGMKRFPVGASKQQKKSARIPALKENMQEMETETKRQGGNPDLATTEIDSNTG